MTINKNRPSCMLSLNAPNHNVYYYSDFESIPNAKYRPSQVCISHLTLLFFKITCREDCHKF